MKLVSWNVNSLKARREHVENYLDTVSPDLLCLQELKCVDEAVPREIFESRGYVVESHGQKTYNGVLMAAKGELADVHRGLPMGDDGQARLIAATWQGIRVVNLYCPQGSDVDSPKFVYKQRFYRRLLDWLAEGYRPDEPVILTGDLNIAPDPGDVWDVEEMKDKVSFHPIEHALWAELIAWGLTDACRPYQPDHTFTFWDYRAGSFRRKRGMRIDHFLLTSPLRDRVRGAQVHIDERRKEKPSDHAPLLLELSEG